MPSLNNRCRQKLEVIADEQYQREKALAEKTRTCIALKRRCVRQQSSYITRNDSGSLKENSVFICSFARHLLHSASVEHKIIPYIYKALFWVLKALCIEGGNLLNHHQCAASTWMMRRQPYCIRTLNTHQHTGGEETEWWSQSVYGDDEEAMMLRGQWANLAKMPGLHPYSFSNDILGFLMTTESQGLGLTSNPKDGAFLTE